MQTDSMYERFRFPVLCLALAVAVTMAMYAQPGVYPSDTAEVEDSTRIYELGTVVVSDRSIRRAEPIATELITAREINRSDPATVADILYEVPAARVQTNSRGEALLYIRNAGERQIALFFDGALLNVPWDNRVDLSLVPTAVVGGIAVEKSIPSVLYGPNTMGGAVNVLTREIDDAGIQTELRASVGQYGYLDGSILHMGSTGSFNYMGSFSYFTRDAIPLPEEADLSFNQTSTTERTNTDSRIASGYLRGEKLFGDRGRVGLSISAIDAEKGVAPEGHTEDARFWRYPDWRNLNVTLNGDIKFGEYLLWRLRGATWFTAFDQRIDDYGSAAYERVESAELGEDLTAGIRLIGSRELDNGTISLSLHDLASTHTLTELSYDSAGAETADPEQHFGHNTFSIGGEYRGSYSDRLNVVLGVGIDGMITTESADKPKQDPFIQTQGNAGLAYAATEGLTLRGAVGRKSRFPSLRELYGEALRRFLINTDLKPESSWSTEAGLSARSEFGRIEATGFAQFVTNTIDQRSIDTLGSTRRQRINLPGSRVFGVELEGSILSLRPLRLNGHVTWTHTRGIRRTGEEADTLVHLSEKPDLLATVNLGYDTRFGLTIDAEALYTGTAFSLNDDNVLVDLDPSLQFNARLAWRITDPFSGLDYLELFLRADNLTDAVVTSQLGLPEAGREIRGGLKVVL